MNWERNLLLLKEVFAEKTGEQGKDLFVGEEDVVGAAELAAGLKGAVVGAESGEADDLGNGEVVVLGLLEKGGSGRGGGVAVVYDEKEG